MTLSVDSAVLPGASVRDMLSRDGKPYRIFVWQPSVEPDAKGFPVLYLLDGNAAFPTTVANLALQSRRPETTGVRPAIIVGIGYPTTHWLDAERRTYDYTPGIERSLLPSRPDNSAWPPTGGADRFLDFVHHELQPKIESEFHVDRSQLSVFGHSFGGLLVLHALFTRAAAFKTYVAASPSIWFARDHLGSEMQSFMREPPLQEPRNLLVTVGSLEQGGTSAGHAGAAGTAPWIAQNRMVENARDLTSTLSTMDSATLKVVFKEFEDENHGSVLPAAISRALRFSLAT